MSEDAVRALGRRLDAARRRRGWTFRDFARHTGLSKSTLQYMIRTRRTAPDYHELVALVEKLGEAWSEEWEGLWRKATDDSEPVLAPAQLPADIGGFTGRAGDLRDLDRARAGGVRVTVLCGTAGVGKTALALHWAHRVRGAFPDGQLYVNLRGYDPGPPLEAADALGGFLRALGVDGRSLPPRTDDRSALLRTLLDGRRFLLLLDNASTVDQVRPLLPGAEGCFVVVTSRDSLIGLAARDGAHRLEIAPFDPDTSRALLRRLIGPRAQAEPEAAAALAAHCAGLPLALRIAAEFAAGRPAAPLSDLAAELAGEHRRLDLLDTGDQHTVIRGVLSWSYRHLPPPTATGFRRLGLHPGRTFGTGAALTLAGSAAVLDDLVRAHLVQRFGSGRFGMHDLLMAYAHELAVTVDSGRSRRACVRRLLDYYVHSAYAANQVLEPHRLPISLPPPARSVEPAAFATPAAALAWFIAEHDALLSAVDTAARSGFDEHTWRLAWTLMTYLERRGHWAAYAYTHQVGLAAAERAGDQPGQAHAHRCLARAYARLGRDADAERHLHRALDLYALLGDDRGCARTHLNMSVAAGRRGRHAEAMDHDRRALDLFRSAGDHHGEALALNQIGCDHAALGDYERARASCRAALDRFTQFGDEPGQAATWDSLGLAHHAAGAYAEAVACFEQALALSRRLGDRGTEADTLINLGQAYADAADGASARTAWKQALEIYEASGHARTRELRARMERDGTP